MAKTKVQSAEEGFDITYEGVPGADSMTEEEASPFTEDLSFGLDGEGNPIEEETDEDSEETNEVEETTEEDSTEEEEVVAEAPTYTEIDVQEDVEALLGDQELSEEFKEKANKSNRKHRDKEEIKPEITEAKNEYELYLVENRVEGMMSKEGIIKSEKEIGKYIGLIMEDAKKDFIEDNEDLFNKVDPNDRKRIFSGTGKIIVPMLSKYL